MFKIPITRAVALTAIAAAVTACATAPASAPRPLMTGPATVSFDGNVAQRATDYVLVLVPDANPATPGFAMAAGDVLRLALPAAFKRNTSVAISADTDLNLLLTKGWPQGAVRLAGQYRVGYEDKTNAITATASQNVAAAGANAPGIKAIHLRGRSFVNPMPGEYPVSVTHTAADGKPVAVWKGQLRVVQEPPRARLAPINFHLPPGSNGDFQQVKAGQVAPRHLGLFVWGEQGSALDGVGIAPPDLTRFPKYIGGLLVQDTNRDRRLDPATDKVVGGIIGNAPPGATGQAATSPLGADGTPVLSGEVLRHVGFPANGGKPNPGLLTIQFKAGDKSGLYRPTVELIGGNSYQFSIEAVNP